MYTIYTDGKLLHDPRLFHEGCGVLSPKLTIELNKAGSLDFTIPPNNERYDDITKLKSIVTVFQNGDELFRGRVLHDEKNFYKQKKTYCEGELAFLIDSTVRPYTFSGTVKNLFTKYITEHNSRVDADKRFTVGKVTVSGNITCENYNYPTTIDEITSQILDVVGGQIMIRKEGSTRYIDLISEEDSTTNTCSQVIEFGSNLLDITEYISAEDIFTVLIPVGATLNDSDGNTTNEKLTIKSVNNGKDYIENSTAISLFGRIEKRVEWSEVEDASELLTLGTELLNSNIEMAVSLTIRAVDLNLLNANVDAIFVGDWVQVLSLPHALNKAFQCTKIVYDMVNPDQNEYTFGIKFSSLTDQQVSDKKGMQNSVSMVLSTAGAVNASVSKVNKASADMENIIAQMPTDYVKTETFEAYKAEVENKFTQVQTNYEDLLARVITLEGGTT